MSFDFNDLSRSGGTSPGPIMWSYLTDDTKSTVLVNGYFNNGFTSFRVNDLIVVVTDLVSFTVKVTGTASGVVTIKEDLTSIQAIPTTAFGEMSVAENTPVIQMLTQYGQMGSVETINVGGTSGVGSSKFFAQSGSSANNIGSVISSRALVYKPGQGAKGRFTAKFDTPKAGNEQDAGLLGFSDTLTLGYNGLDFGIWHRFHAEPEVQALTINGAASGAENATVTIDGTGYTVALTNVTAAQNAYEIMVSLNSQIQVWDFDCAGAIVTAVQNLVSETIGSFAFSSSTATASWAQSQAAIEWSEANGNINFIKEDDWNGDTSFSIAKTKLTPFEVSFEYLGGGGIDIKAENPSTARFEVIHTIQFAGTSDNTSFRNPSFRIGWASENKANDTVVRVEGASAAGFVEGKKVNVSPSRAQSFNQASVSTTPTNVITLRCKVEFGMLRNLAEVMIAITGASSDSTKPVDVELIKNAIPSTPLSFVDFDSSESVVQVATNSTAMTGGTVIAAGEPGSLDLDKLNQVLIPGETLSIVMNTTSGAASSMKASVIWIEDQ